ncbi:VCBS domain-containing protein [Mesorhizobium opportunistum]|uniref:VCBS domain-containing protein n=1 Tax=Mesorhizobium opportunistum TaxID=593909 RepID=UPI002577D49C|nr:VCBS domain-containing protein [Mesorhizobium opportunistum]WJI42130.1 VCBS domain-containing protein [Mesorhizobium opportunistum]
MSSLDGTASQTITVTIHGTNDAATITASATEDTSVTEAGAGNATTAATPGDATAGGTLTVHDVDAGQAHFAAVAPAAPRRHLRQLQLRQRHRVWGYTLDNSKAATRSAQRRDTQTDTLTVSSLDGHRHQTITVTSTAPTTPPPSPHRPPRTPRSPKPAPAMQRPRRRLATPRRAAR